MAVQDVINETGLPKAMIARLAGVNEATVWSWLRPRSGAAAHTPSPQSIEKLARGLRAYSEKLAGLAGILEREADRG